MMIGPTRKPGPEPSSEPTAKALERRRWRARQLAKDPVAYREKISAYARNRRESKKIADRANGLTEFQHSKIYRIVSDDSPEVYVGCTIRPLSIRMSQHISDSKVSSRRLCNLMADMGPDKWRIELIEEFPCQNYKELLERERVHIAQEGTLNTQGAT